jgi:hypothetical protein
MNAPHHNSTATLMNHTTRLRSMLAMIARGLARLDGAQRANERRARERVEQLARWELDQRVREVGEW